MKRKRRSLAKSLNLQKMLLLVLSLADKRQKMEKTQMKIKLIRQRNKVKERFRRPRITMKVNKFQ